MLLDLHNFLTDTILLASVSNLFLTGIALVKKNKVYYAVISCKHKKKWIKIGKVNIREAKKIVKFLNLQEIYSRLQNYTANSKIKFKDFISEYLSYAYTNKSKHTYRREKEIISMLSKYFSSVHLCNINTKLIESYKLTRVKANIKNSTVNRELTVLRSILKLAYRLHYIDTIPEIKTLKVNTSKHRVLSYEELRKLIDSSSLWLKHIIHVLYYTGIRPCELKNLKVTDIDYDKRLLHVYSSKTNSCRTIPVNRSLYNTLLTLRDKVPLQYKNDYIERTDKHVYLFCNEDGSQLKTFRGSFKKACKKANLSEVTLYTLRHTFASHLVNSGVSLLYVKELLGHSNITTTLTYTHVKHDNLFQSVDKLYTMS